MILSRRVNAQFDLGRAFPLSLCEGLVKDGTHNRIYFDAPAAWADELVRLRSSSLRRDRIAKESKKSHMTTVTSDPEADSCRCTVR